MYFLVRQTEAAASAVPSRNTVELIHGQQNTATNIHHINRDSAAALPAPQRCCRHSIQAHARVHLAKSLTPVASYHTRGARLLCTSQNCHRSPESVRVIVESVSDCHAEVLLGVHMVQSVFVGNSRGRGKFIFTNIPGWMIRDHMHHVRAQ